MVYYYHYNQNGTRNRYIFDLPSSSERAPALVIYDFPELLFIIRRVLIADDDCLLQIVEQK